MVFLAALAQERIREERGEREHPVLIRKEGKRRNKIGYFKGIKGEAKVWKIKGN